MRRTIRIAIAIVGVLVVAVVAVRLLVPAEKWRQLALEQFEKRTGMQATAGSASIQFPWPVGLRLSQVELTDERDDAAYDRLHAGVDEVVVSAELMSLLKRRPKVNEIRLVRPQVELWLRPKPEGSRESAAEGADRPGSPTADAIPEGTAAVLGLISIEKGDLRLHQADGRDVHLQEVDQRSSLRMEENGQASGTMTATVKGGSVRSPDLPEPLALPALSLETAFTTNLRERKGSLQVERLTVEAIELSGPIGWDFSGSTRSLDATLEVQADLPQVHRRLGSFMPVPPPWDEQLKVVAGELTGRIRVAGALPAEGLDPAALAEMVSGEGEIAQLRASVLADEDVRAKTSWSLRDGVLQLDALELTGPGMRAVGRVEVPALGSGNVKGDLRLELDLEPLREAMLALVPLLPEQTQAWPEPELWPRSSGTVEASLELDLPLGEAVDPERRPVICHARPGQVRVGLAGVSGDFSITGGSIVASLLEAEVSDLAMTGPGLAGVFDARLSGWPEQIVCDLDATLERFDVDAFQAAWQPPEKTAWIDGIGVRPAVAAESPGVEPEKLPAPPENLTVHFTATAAQVKTRGYTLEQVRAQGTLAEQRLDARQLVGKLGSGDLKGRATVDWTSDPPRWEADAQAEAVPAGSLFQPFAGLLASSLSTDVSGAMGFRGPLGAEPEVMRAQLDGEGSIQTAAGRLLTEPILGVTIPQFLGAVGESFKGLDFDRLIAGIRVDQGRVQFDKLFVDGPTSVEASGWVGLMGRCDYRLRVKLPPNATPKLGDLAPLADLLRDDQKRITFQVAVTGPTAKPKVEIDQGDLERRAKDAAAGAARNELNRLLEDKLGGAQADSSGAGVNDDLKDKAEDALNDLLRGLGGKKDKGGG